MNKIEMAYKNRDLDILRNLVRVSAFSIELEEIPEHRAILERLLEDYDDRIKRSGYCCGNLPDLIRLCENGNIKIETKYITRIRAILRNGRLDSFLETYSPFTEFRDVSIEPYEDLLDYSMLDRIDIYKYYIESSFSNGSITVHDDMYKKIYILTGYDNRMVLSRYTEGNRADLIRLSEMRGLGTKFNDGDLRTCLRFYDDRYREIGDRIIELAGNLLDYMKDNSLYFISPINAILEHLEANPHHRQRILNVLYESEDIIDPKYAEILRKINYSIINPDILRYVFKHSNLRGVVIRHRINYICAALQIKQSDIARIIKDNENMHEYGSGEHKLEPKRITEEIKDLTTEIAGEIKDPIMLNIISRELELIPSSANKLLEKYIGGKSISPEEIAELIISGKDVDLAYVNQLPIIFEPEINLHVYSVVADTIHGKSSYYSVFAPPLSGGTIFSRQLLCRIINEMRHFNPYMIVNGYWCRDRPNILPPRNPREYRIIVFESLKREFISPSARTSIINIYSSCSVMENDRQLPTILSEDQNNKLREFFYKVDMNESSTDTFGSSRSFSCILSGAAKNHISVRRFPMSCLLRLIESSDRRLLAKIALCYLLSTSMVQLDETIYWNLFTLQAKLEVDHFLPRIKNKVYAEGLIRSWTFINDNECLSNLDECVKNSLINNEDKQNPWHQMDDKDIRKLLKLVMDVYVDMVEHKTLDPSSPIKTSYFSNNASPKSRALTLAFIDDSPPSPSIVLESINGIIGKLRKTTDRNRNIVSLVHAFTLSYPSETKRSAELLNRLYSLEDISGWPDSPEDVKSMALSIYLFKRSSMIEKVKAILEKMPRSKVITSMIEKANRLIFEPVDK